jgi:glycyl-radical enzyme activating protein
MPLATSAACSAPGKTAEDGSVARLFDIKKMAVHDGPGIRTTVFFKGCPLRCQWCHSPESMIRDQQIRFVENLCTDCGNCMATCPQGCHIVDAVKGHTYLRDDCIQCGQCIETCPSDALGMIGYDATLDEVTEILLKDKKYFDASGGGVTFSGGEAMAQSEFVLALAKRMQAAGIHVALDTCGQPMWSRYEPVMEYVDLVLFDIKETDPAKHRAFTGADNERILENLRRIDATGTEIYLRCCLVPGLNATPEHFAALGALADSLENVTVLNVLPFHPFGRSKSAMIGQTYPLAHIPTVEDETAEEWIAEIQAHTKVRVSRG